MSVGAFELFKYQTSETPARILTIRLQPETVDADNPEPAGGATGQGRVRAPGKSRKSYGIHARYVTLSRKIGTADGPFTGGSVSVKFPLLTEAAKASFPEGTTVLYGGVADWVVVGFTPELIK